MSIRVPSSCARHQRVASKTGATTLNETHVLKLAIRICIRRNRQKSPSAGGEFVVKNHETNDWSISRNPPRREKPLARARAIIIIARASVTRFRSAPVYKTRGRDPRAKVELFFSMFIEDLAWK